MKVSALTPVLWTLSLQETINFYSIHLGFTCSEKKDEWGWAAINNGNIDIMLSVPNEHMPFEKSMFTGSFYFKIDNVTDLYEKLKDQTKVVYPIEDFEWGMREFAIFDNNGYILQFGQPI